MRSASMPAPIEPDVERLRAKPNRVGKDTARRLERERDLPHPKRPVPALEAEKGKSQAATPPVGEAAAENRERGSALPFLDDKDPDQEPEAMPGAAPMGRLSPELLRDLPAPLGPSPRQPDAGLAAAYRPRKDGAERAARKVEAPRIAVTRPEIPAVRRAPPPAASISATSSAVLNEKGPPTRPELPPAGDPTPLRSPIATTPKEAAPAIGLSELTAPEPIEAMEQRMQAALANSPTGAPGRSPAGLPDRSPGRPPEQSESLSAAASLLAKGTSFNVEGSPSLALPPKEAAGQSPKAVPPGALLDRPAPSSGPESPPLFAPSPRPGMLTAAEPAENAAAARTLDNPDESAETRGTPEAVPPKVDLVEPPHLPMGWIIGALFVLALLLTLWIAHRAGVFGSTSISPTEFDPTTTTPPRMP